MAEVTTGWRRPGGGGIALGGLIWALGVVIYLVDGPLQVSFWVSAVGILITAIALWLSSAAAGSIRWGRLGFLLAALGMGLGIVVQALAVLGLGLPDFVGTVLDVVELVGLVLASVAVLRAGVAKGFASWALFLPTAWTAIALLAALGVPIPTDWWLALGFGVLYVVTGVAYLTSGRRSA